MAIDKIESGKAYPTWIQMLRRSFDSTREKLVLISYDFNLYLSQRIIKKDYGDNVSITLKDKTLLKYGENPNVGSTSSGYTIWYTGQDQAHETYPANNVNSIDTISAANSSDTGKEVTIEGHTQSGGDRTFVSQTATLLGNNKVSLTTPLNRATRIYNSGTVNLLGEVYCYEDTAISGGKPSDTTKIHITLPQGANQTRKASTSLSSQDYWIVTQFRASMLEKASSFADVQLQYRQNGFVFRQLEDVTCSSNHNGVINFNPYLVIPKNSDIRLVAISDSTSRNVSGAIQGYLAQVVT